jgi:hypothetical protein
LLGFEILVCADEGAEACLSNPFFIEAQPSIGTVVTE